MKKVLFISHEASITGAPIYLKNLMLGLNKKQIDLKSNSKNAFSFLDHVRQQSTLCNRRLIHSNHRMNRIYMFTLKLLLGALFAFVFSGRNPLSGEGGPSFLGFAEAKKPRKASDWAKVNFNGVEQQYEAGDDPKLLITEDEEEIARREKRLLEVERGNTSPYVRNTYMLLCSGE